MRKFIIIPTLALVIALAGCQTATPKFDATEHAPKGATNLKAYTFDANNDGIDEKAISYNYSAPETETIEPTNDFVDVFALNKTVNAWEPQMDYVVPERWQESGRIQPTPEVKIKEVRVVDIAADGKEELLVIRESIPFEGNLDGYAVIGEENNEIKVTTLEQGSPYINSILIDFYGRPLAFEVQEGKIIESWGGTCEGSSEPCYTFDLAVSYNPAKQAWSVSKAYNIEQTEAYNTWMENYPDTATEWDGELIF